MPYSLHHLQPIRALATGGLLTAVLLSGTVRGQLPDFNRYQQIIDKAVFGSTPPVVVQERPPPPPPPAGPSWINDYRMTMLIKRDDGTFKVGLQNTKDQTVWTLRTGGNPAASDGISIVNVDYGQKVAVLSRMGDVQTIGLQDASATPPPTAKAPAGGRPSPPRIPTPNGGNPGFRNRAPRIITPPRPAEDAPPRLSGAELDQHLQNYQVEVLRQGLPPLPVQLTPENDARLVEEGVLPPVGQ